MNTIPNPFRSPRFAEQAESIDALSFKDVAAFLGIGEMTAYQDEQKALALLRKAFPTPDALLSESLAADRNACDSRAAAHLHPRHKNWVPVSRIVCGQLPAPCLTTTAIVFQLLYRRNARYRPAVFGKHHSCWRQVAQVRRLIFSEERLLAQLNRPVASSPSLLEGISLGLQIELEDGIDEFGRFKLPVPTAFFVLTPSEKDSRDAE